MKIDSKVKAIKAEKSFGSLYLNSKDAPFLKDASIGDVVKVEISLKIRSLRAPDNWDISEKKLSPTDVVVEGTIVKLESEDKSMDKS